MITVEVADHEYAFEDAREAGKWLALRISTFGFAEFFVDFGEGAEVEWTDPDLFLEFPDIEYFLEIEVPEAFVRAVFINWQVYSKILRGTFFPGLGTGKGDVSEGRKCGRGCGGGEGLDEI